MSDPTSPDPRPGTIAWVDLTVPDAARIREFYVQVAGWTATAVDMGGYEDFVMQPAGAEDAVAGVCHARGENANLPPQWLIYILVPSLEHALARCLELGGSVVDGPRLMGGGAFCAIRDPAGAVSALYQRNTEIPTE